MDASAFLGGRDALRAMAAGFIVEGGDIRAFATKDEDGMPGARIQPGRRADCSTFAIGEADISLGEFDDQKARIIAAFSSAKFKIDKHFVLHSFEATGVVNQVNLLQY